MHNLAQLGLPDKGHAFKGLVVCWILIKLMLIKQYVQINDALRFMDDVNKEDLRSNKTDFNIIIFHFNIRGKQFIIRCDK